MLKFIKTFKMIRQNGHTGQAKSNRLIACHLSSVCEHIGLLQYFFRDSHKLCAHSATERYYCRLTEVVVQDHLCPTVPFVATPKFYN